MCIYFSQVLVKVLKQLPEKLKTIAKIFHPSAR